MQPTAYNMTPLTSCTYTSAKRHPEPYTNVKDVRLSRVRAQVHTTEKQIKEHILLRRMCSTSKDVRLSRVRAQGASLHLPSGWEEDGRKEGGMALGGVDGVGRRQEISQWHQGPWLSVISPTRCLICMPYIYALYVCLICMPYMYALYVCPMCMPYMYALSDALYVCPMCMPYTYG